MTGEKDEGQAGQVSTVMPKEPEAALPIVYVGGALFSLAVCPYCQRTDNRGLDPGVRACKFCGQAFEVV